MRDNPEHSVMLARCRSLALVAMARATAAEELATPPPAAGAACPSGVPPAAWSRVPPVFQAALLKVFSSILEHNPNGELRPFVTDAAGSSRARRRSTC